MIWFILLAIALRVATLALSIRNERRLRTDGAVEYGAASSTALALAHVLFYVAASIEGLWRSPPLDAVGAGGLLAGRIGRRRRLLAHSLSFPGGRPGLPPFPIIA